MQRPGVAPAAPDGMTGVHQADPDEVEAGELGEEEGGPAAHDAATDNNHVGNVSSSWRRSVSL